MTVQPKWLPEVHSPGHILQGPSSPAHDSSERGHKTLGYMGHMRIGPVGVSPTYSHPKSAIQTGRPLSLHSLQTMTMATAGHTILSTQRGLSPSYTAEGLKMGGEDRKADGVPQSAYKTGARPWQGKLCRCQLGPYRKGTCHQREGSVQGVNNET